jgi:uncharacterized protein
MKNYPIIDMIAVILLLAGGINWGLVGLFKLDLVTAIFGGVLARIVFVLVGLAAAYRIVLWARSKAK